MKKLIYCALALAAGLFAASCQQENLEPVQGGNTVTFTVEIPEVATKAIGDAENVDNLVYAVYRVTGENEADAKANLTPEKFVYQDHNSVLNGKSTVSLELINDQAYLILFWAQVGNTWFDNEYQFGTKKVTYPSGLVANNDKYSAFYGVSYIDDVKGPATKDITLHRPFAQINVATNDPENYNVVINKTSVTVANAASGFDVAKEEAIVTPDYSVSFEAAQMPENEILTVNNVTYKTGVQNTGSKENDEHHYVAMNYVFAAGNVNVSYVIDTDHGTVSNTINNVPVAKNYRTNIVGGLLTSNVDYEVTIDNKWTGQFISANNASEFADALTNAQSGDIINVAEGEFDLPSSLFDQATSGTFTIAGSGADTKLKGAVNDNENHPGNYAYGKHIVLKDLTYITPNKGYNGGFGHAASVTFINCTIIGQMYAHSSAPHYFYDCTIDPLTGYLYTYSSDCVFDGCTFNASEGKALQIYSDGQDGVHSVTIRDCNFVAAKHAQTWDGKPVTGIDINSNGAIFNVSVENCTTTGFPTGLNSGTALYNIKDGGLTKTNLVVDGVYVNIAGDFTKLANYPSIWVKENNYYVFDKDGLEDLNAYFAANAMANVLWSREYHIGADIDASGYTWNSVFVVVGNNANNGLVINGNGHTISNLTINGSFFTGTPNGSNDGTTPGYVKDITIDNATVSGASDAAVFWGNSYGELVYDNVTVTNTSVTGDCNAAIFLGRTTIEDGTEIDNILFKNCKVENCSVIANGCDNQDPTGASGFVGRAFGKTSLKFEGENTIDEATTITNNNGLVGGRVYAYTTWVDGGFAGTGSCDTFTNWNGIAAVNNEEALKEALKGQQTVVLADNVTVTDAWDARYTGGKTTYPVVIDGNGKTLKFAGDVSDAGNHDAAFRFENDAVVKNLKIDLSESTNSGRLRAISAKGNLVVEDCVFIGNPNNTKSRAIIYGEGQQQAQYDAEISISGCEFTNWTRGLTDNENAKDVRKVTVAGNTFNNAHAYMSAYETVTFTGNTMNNSCVNIKSYSAPDSVIITVNGNDLDENQDNKY